jgi:hypothetical protein
MIPKSGNRFSDKIMLKTKNLAHADINQAWRTARLPPTSGRGALAFGRGQGRLGKAVYHLLHRRRDVWPSVIGAIHDRAVSA